MHAMPCHATHVRHHEALDNLSSRNHRICTSWRWAPLPPPPPFPVLRVLHQAPCRLTSQSEARQLLSAEAAGEVDLSKIFGVTPRDILTLRRWAGCS